jgi:hypothetical protein
VTTTIRDLRDPLEVVLSLHARPKPWSTNDARTMIGPVQNQHAQPWKEATRLAMREYRIGQKVTGDYVFPRGVVQVTIPFDRSRDRDPHNYCGTVLKAVIDGLKDDRVPVKGKGMVLRSRGLWPDDTPEYVGHREPILVVDKTGKVRPTVSIFFEVHP